MKQQTSFYDYDHIVEVPGFFSSQGQNQGSNQERNLLIQQLQANQTSSSQTSVVQSMQQDQKTELSREETKPPVAERLKSVYAFQQFLADYNYQISIVDGWFGKQTEQEVRRFQADYKLTVTGTVNSATAQKMDELRREKEIDLDPNMLGKVVDMSVPLATAMSAEGISTIAPVSKKPSKPSIAAKIVQDFLLMHYPELYSNSVDGWYGNKSGESIRKFKLRHNLSNDKIVDRPTVELIESQRTTGPQSSGTGNQLGGNPYQYEFTAYNSFLAEGLSENDSLAYGMTVEQIPRLVAVGKYDPRPMSARIAQTILKELRLYNDVIDGWYGKGSARSTSAFQAKYGLQVTGEVDSETAQKMDQVRAQNQNLTFHEIQYVEGPRPSGKLFNNSDRPEVNAIQNEIIALQNRFNDEQTQAMYNQYYDYSEIVDVKINNVWEQRVGGEYLKSFLEGKNGTAYATNELVGMDDLEAFIAEGHLEVMTVSELELFRKAISQLGSLYGKNDYDIIPSNGLKWTPEGVTARSNGLVEQTDDQVGKWDCSGYTAYVTGHNFSSSQIAGRTSDDPSKVIVAKGKPIEAEWTDEELRQRLTVGTILARDGHVILVLGHYGNGEVFVSEAAGSGDFLKTERRTMERIREGNPTYNIKPMTHYLNPPN